MIYNEFIDTTTFSPINDDLFLKVFKGEVEFKYTNLI